MDQQRFLDWTIELNNLIKETAESFGFLYVDIYDVFEGHEACGQGFLGEAWVFPMNYGFNPGILHPNKAGHEAVAQAVEVALYNIGF
jgi:lysophospholipase L1-like esterase